jgi:hypothetical protein
MKSVTEVMVMATPACCMAEPIRPSRLCSASYTNRFLSSSSRAVATLPPFGPIEGHKWFFQISSQ